MSFLIYYTLFLAVISFWLVGFFYVKQNNLLLAKQNEAGITKAKLSNKIAALEKQKEKLMQTLKKLEQKLKTLEQKNSSTSTT